MEVAERVEAVRARYAKPQLLFPELVRDLIWKQVSDTTSLPDALNYEVWQEHSADTGRCFRFFGDPLARRITDDSTGDADKIPVNV